MPSDTSHAELMDATYRHQRRIYDLTRRYYLLGRDHLISELAPPPKGRVLEVACGTGRNLALIAKRHPECLLCGLDISAEMLWSATAKMQGKGLEGRVELARADATDFDPKAVFGVQGFDRIVLSYAVSMIPGWQAALRHAARQLAPGGEVHVVDFSSQNRLPRWFGRGLTAWLAKFHVTPRADLAIVGADIADEIGGASEWRTLYRDYAQYLVIRAPG
ncbi:class I SAM-dependent methyltransferase [Halovulum sp. GXIMD14793]